MIDNLEGGQFKITGPRSSEDDGLYVGTYSYRLANKRSHPAKSNFSGDPSTSEMTETASGAGNANFDIDARMDHNAFIIAAGTGESVEVKTKILQHNPSDKDYTTTLTGPRQPEGTGVSGTMDPKNPNELKGNKTDKSPDGTVTTVEWNLVRCSK